MKRKTINKLYKKGKASASPLGIPDLVTALRQESAFSNMSKAEAQTQFERMLGSARRWVDTDEYRQPAPLGPLRVEYDEDGVPNYLED